MKLILNRSWIDKFFSLLDFPPQEKDLLISFLRKFKARKDLYIVGGAVRDFLIGKKIVDLDIAVGEEVEKLVIFAKEYLKYHFVPLAPELGIYRIAKRKNSIDFTYFRGNTIEEDLEARDFTFNAIAIPIRSLFEDTLKLIDPFRGYKDLVDGVIRIIGEKNILEDPLRILRGYRFFAQGLGEIDEKTRTYFRFYRELLLSCAKERILQELIYILTSEKTYLTFKLMEEDGVLEVLFPVLKDARGVVQPGFHHLDVYGHLFESLRWAEEILKDPKKYLGLEKTEDFLKEDTIISAKLASFFHDLGKAYTFEIRDRITFYGHEKVSSEIFREVFENYRLKRDLISKTCTLIKNHMRPFHLLREKEEGRLTLRAKRKLLEDVPFWLELFIVAMADSLASQGPDKEPDYEERLKVFFYELKDLKEELERVSVKERIITGKDLIALGLKPGPIFKEILQEIEMMVLENKIKSKEDAIRVIRERYTNL